MRRSFLLRCAPLSFLTPAIYSICDPGRWGKPHEAARVQHTTRRRGGNLAARGARAAAPADASHWRADECGRRRSGGTGPSRRILSQGLAELGWTIGRNVRIDYRWYAGNADAARKYAAEFLRLPPAVAVASATLGVTAI